MTPNNKLEAILMARTEGTITDTIAIIAAVRWIAEHECPEGFGTYWHEKCKKLVEESR